MLIRAEKEFRDLEIKKTKSSTKHRFLSKKIGQCVQEVFYKCELLGEIVPLIEFQSLLFPLMEMLSNININNLKRACL